MSPTYVVNEIRARMIESPDNRVVMVVAHPTSIKEVNPDGKTDVVELFDYPFRCSFVPDLTVPMNKFDIVYPRMFENILKPELEAKPPAIIPFFQHAGAMCIDGWEIEEAKRDGKCSHCGEVSNNALDDCSDECKFCAQCDYCTLKIIKEQKTYLDALDWNLKSMGRRIKRFELPDTAEKVQLNWTNGCCGHCGLARLCIYSDNPWKYWFCEPCGSKFETTNYNVSAQGIAAWNSTFPSSIQTHFPIQTKGKLDKQVHPSSFHMELRPVLRKPERFVSYEQF